MVKRDLYTSSKLRPQFEGRIQPSSIQKKLGAYKRAVTEFRNACDLENVLSPWRDLFGIDVSEEGVAGQYPFLKMPHAALIAEEGPFAKAQAAAEAKGLTAKAGEPATAEQSQFAQKLQKLCDTHAAYHDAVAEAAATRTAERKGK